MTRSSDTPWYFSVPAVLFTAAITGLISVGATWTAVTSGEDRSTMIVVALFTGTVSLMMLTSLGRDAGTWSLAELDGRPAWRMRLGPSRASAAAVVAVLVATGLGLAGGAYVVGQRSAAGAVTVGAIALAMLLLALELGRAVARAPHLLIGIDRLHHHGAGVLVDLAWDDVGTIEWADVGTRWACVRISAVAGASSHRVEARGSLLPLDRVPERPGIELRLTLLPDAPAVLRMLRELELGGRATREALIPRGTPHFPIR